MPKFHSIPHNLLFKDMTGEQFGRWTVLGYAGSALKRKGRAVWHCECQCGVQRPIDGSSLRRGISVSCGCERAEKASARWKTHGESRNKGNKGSKEYNCWMSMVKRVECKKPKVWAVYGGRGIIVCEAWKTNFQAFLAHVGRAPSARHSLDRIRTDGNYEPGNVAWVLPIHQAYNRRNRGNKGAQPASANGMLGFGA